MAAKSRSKVSRRKPKGVALDTIVVKGAREHNLKNIDIELPKKKFIVFSGVSGSGKSSLAFDTIFAEGQRRYVESLSAYARQFIGQMDKPHYDTIRGLSPTISIDQKAASRNPRSTVGRSMSKVRQNSKIQAFGGSLNENWLMTKSKSLMSHY